MRPMLVRAKPWAGARLGSVCGSCTDLRPVSPALLRFAVARRREFVFDARAAHAPTASPPLLGAAHSPRQAPARAFAQAKAKPR
jgi:hypothetical protein